MKAIVVEKNDSNFILIQAYLEKINAKAIRVDNLLDIIEIIKKQDIDMALINTYKLENEDGIEITQKIKSINPNLPVVIISTNTFPNVIFNCYNAGCDDYLLKPFSFNHFYEVMEKLCCLDCI
jgi:CheY-like chemotaxis protein